MDQWKKVEHDKENEDEQSVMSRNSANDTRVNGDDGEYMNVSKAEEKTLQCMKDVVKKTHEDEVITMAKASGDEMADCIEANSIEYPDDTLFCVCKQPNNASEPYAQCSICKDWFHPVCIGYQSVEDIAAISPWYCPSCSTDAKATDSGRKDNIKRRLSLGR